MTNIIAENTLNTMNTTENIPETTTKTTPKNMTTPEIITEIDQNGNETKWTVEHIPVFIVPTYSSLRSLHKEVKPIETANYYDVKDIATAKGFNKVHIGNKGFNIDISKKYVIKVISFRTKATSDRKNLSNNLVKKTLNHVEFKSKNNVFKMFNYIKDKLEQQNLKASVLSLIAEDDYKAIIHNNPTATLEEKKALIRKATTFYLIDGRPLTDYYTAIDTYMIKRAEKSIQECMEERHQFANRVKDALSEDQKQNILSQLTA